MTRRVLAAFCLFPPVPVCWVWGLVTLHATRGPAGGAAALLLFLLPMPCAWWMLRILQGAIPPWGRRTQAVLCLEILALGLIVGLRPRLRSLHAERAESASRRGLSALRSAVAAYRLRDGRPPERLSGLVPSFLPVLPRLSLPGTGHPLTREVRLSGSGDLRDSGKWLYVDRAGDPGIGSVLIDCTHTDSRGSRWSGY